MGGQQAAKNYMDLRQEILGQIADRRDQHPAEVTVEGHPKAETDYQVYLMVQDRLIEAISVRNMSEPYAYKVVGLTTAGYEKLYKMEMVQGSLPAKAGVVDEATVARAEKATQETPPPPKAQSAPRTTPRRWLWLVLLMVAVPAGAWVRNQRGEFFGEQAPPRLEEADTRSKVDPAVSGPATTGPELAKPAGVDEETAKTKESPPTASAAPTRPTPARPEMVMVPAGRFLMGSPKDEEGRYKIEGRQSEVTFDQPFAIGKYEVTFDEWDACVAGSGCNGHRPADRGWNEPGFRSYSQGFRVSRMLTP